MGIPDHLTCLLRNLYASQEGTVRTGHGTIDWFQIGKGVRQGCILSPCLFNFYAEYIMRNTGLDESQTEIKIARRNINNLRWYHSDGRKWRGTKMPLNEGERGEWKIWLKTQHSENENHGIWSHYVMANLLLLLFSRSVVSDPLWPMDCSTPGLPVHHQLPEFT